MLDRSGEPRPNCIVIDDDPAVRRIVSHYVTEMLGVAPQQFELPSDALDYAALNPEIGVILIDWHLGDTNGLQWLAPLGREWPAAVFIVMSADSDPRGFVEATKCCRTALWWRKTDSIAMLGSLIQVAMEEHRRRILGESSQTLSELKDQAIREALALHGGNIDQAAKALGISASTIRRHLST